MYQPDPPGLIHDDPRLLPPWRGSSHFYGSFSPYGVELGSRALRECVSVVAVGVRVATRLCTLASLSTDLHLGLLCQGPSAAHGGRVADGCAEWMGQASAGVLAVLADPDLRAELDRVAAAAGVRVVACQ